MKACHLFLDLNVPLRKQRASCNTRGQTSTSIAFRAVWVWPRPDFPPQKMSNCAARGILQMLRSNWQFVRNMLQMTPNGPVPWPQFYSLRNGTLPVAALRRPRHECAPAAGEPDGAWVSPFSISGRQPHRTKAASTKGDSSTRDRGQAHLEGGKVAANASRCWPSLRSSSRHFQNHWTEKQITLLRTIPAWDIYLLRGCLSQAPSQLSVTGSVTAVCQRQICLSWALSAGGLVVAVECHLNSKTPNLPSGGNNTTQQPKNTTTATRVCR